MYLFSERVVIKCFTWSKCTLLKRGTLSASAGVGLLFVACLLSLFMFFGQCSFAYFSVMCNVPGLFSGFYNKNDQSKCLLHILFVQFIIQIYRYHVHVVMFNS